MVGMATPQNLQVQPSITTSSLTPIHLFQDVFLVRRLRGPMTVLSIEFKR